MKRSITLLAFLLPALPASAASVPVAEGDHIVFTGDGLGSRALHFSQIETELHQRFPDKALVLRNVCDEGNTPGFRPHPGRPDPWAFPGAEKFQSEFANPSKPQGHFASPDEWLTKLKADTLIAFFGFSSSFGGADRLPIFKAELEAFVQHTLAQKYNGESGPRLALVSPIAFEPRPDLDVPKPGPHNRDLAATTEAMREVAAAHNLPFVDAFAASQAWYKESKDPLTIDGALLSEAGYRKLATLVADGVFGESKSEFPDRDKLHAAVREKNWIWQNWYKIPNGVHVYGRRYNPYGPANYPFELEKLEQMCANRDEAIHALLAGKPYNLAKADAKTRPLPPVETNFNPDNKKAGQLDFKDGQAVIQDIKMAEGYHIDLFASEKEFPDLANPVQMSFDNQGRLWIATMPSYPHYRPGDARPTDKLLILEDTDGDHRADKQTVFAGDLHLPMGFEFAPEGVYVSQGFNLVLLVDEDGDDHYDERRVILSGFDDHDTHHAISAYCADPSGAFYMCEGVFLHSNIDTRYGTIRGTNGGFFRYNPARKHLERYAQLSIPNPWGVAFDEWGQDFFLITSGTKACWMMPGSHLPRYGEAGPNLPDLIPKEARVRPTSGIEFVSSRHFPDEHQGDMLLNNTIGFLGTKQHQIEDDQESAGYKTAFRQDLMVSAHGNFRPVDLEFAPDGSLYVVDWHNPLIGHMQHNARDPNRDHKHGRVYRITYPSRPLVEPAEVAGAPIATLLDNLKLPEYRTRYRTRRELRGRDADEVLAALGAWVAKLDQAAPRFEHHRLEALWVTWGLNRVDPDLLSACLASDDHRVRAAAVRVVRYNPQIDNQAELLMAAANDEHGRVRLEAIAAASRLPRRVGLPILKAAGQHPLDSWMKETHQKAVAHINQRSVKAVAMRIKPPKHLKDAEAQALYKRGHAVYNEAENCVMCHAPDGQGLAAANFPPLAGTRWATQNPERMIKLTLKGLMGPIEVGGKEYNGAMVPFEHRLDDEEIAAVLTFVRNAFGNQASVVTPDQVKAARAKFKDDPPMVMAEDLLKQFPHEK